MASYVNSRKSTSGYLVTFVGGAISWQSKLQKCIALSTTEVEFIAIIEVCKEMLCMKWFIGEIGLKQRSMLSIVIVKVPSLVQEFKFSL